MNLRPAAAVPGQMEQAISLMGGGNRDHPYGSRDAQGESVLFNTGGQERCGGPIQEGAFRNRLRETAA
jgi:hypothetical protein